MTGIAGESHEAFAGDLDLVVEAHKLSYGERAELARIVAGAVTGNRDRPLFLLALKLYASGTDDLLSLIMPGAPGLRPVDAALIDFLITSALESAEAVSDLITSFGAARCTADPARAFTPRLSAVLHAYRARVLPETRHHNVFAAVRRYLAGCRPDDPWPQDGDAPRFWVTEGRRDFLTRYVTALRAMADYSDAARLAASWREFVALDVAEVMAASSSEEQDAVIAEDSLGPERLATSLTLLSQTPVKLLLAHELDSLRDLTEHADLALRWPGDVQAALTHGPVQAAITQALRRTDVRVDIATLIEKGPSRQDVLDRIDHLAVTLSACLHLIHESITPNYETGTPRSSAPDVDTRKIAAMKRRQGFAGLSVDERNAALTQLIEPVLRLAQLVERYRRGWERLGRERGSALESEHRALFCRKLAELYFTGKDG